MLDYFSGMQIILITICHRCVFNISMSNHFHYFCVHGFQYEALFVYRTVRKSAHVRLPNNLKNNCFPWSNFSHAEYDLLNLFALLAW